LSRETYADQALLFELYVYLSVAARRGLVYNLRNPVKVQTYNPPGGVSKYDNANLPGSQVLLIPNVLIGSEQKIKPFCLSRCQQFAIGDLLPTTVNCLCDIIPRKRSGNAARCAVIKENAHRSARFLQR